MTVAEKLRTLNTKKDYSLIDNHAIKQLKKHDTNLHRNLKTKTTF